MNAQEFALEFVSDILEDLKTSDLKENKFVFSYEVYEQDPELKILKSELRKINFDLIPEKDSSNKTDLSWKLTTI